ncbi:MAG: hypothetical protein GTN76_13345 [Candidatus Aenigmarchaeota archaeon]|nr:hypothetical protein [Candidatus Aenigmarchaeota archaeon]
MKILTKIKRIMPREYEVGEIKENMQTGELHFGDKITVLGTFSEYLPFIDPEFILKEEARLLPQALPRTARIDAIDDIYCGALFSLDQDNAFANEVIPIFHSIDSRMIEHFTGEMLELECKVIGVPLAYKGIINQNKFFTFEKEEGVKIPFGLEVLNVKPYGLIDSFKINAWLVGNLSPSPTYKTIKQRTCQNCGYLFSYMTIKPVEWPPKHGCFMYCDTHARAHIPKELTQQSKKFLGLEKDAIPYVAFPKPFELFEVFYPIVDILNDNDRENSKSILLASVKQNISSLFKYPGGFLEGIEIPDKFVVNVDFQYDQLSKITQQNFNTAGIPEWICPGYEPRSLDKPKTRKK